jgi:hypothetical protein
LRAFLLERGLVFAKSPAKLRERMLEILENEEDLTPRIPITETLADQQGRFSLPWPSKRVCLQAKSLGMNLLQIEVLRDPNAGELQVKLVPGT